MKKLRENLWLVVYAFMAVMTLMFASAIFVVETGMAEEDKIVIFGRYLFQRIK